MLLFLRFHFAKPKYINGDKIRLTATVLKDPIIYDNYQYIKVANLSFYLPNFPEVYYGDKIVVEGFVKNGKLENPKLINVKKSGFAIYSFRNKIIDFYKSVLPEPAAGLMAGIVLGSKGALTNEFWESVKKVGVAHVVVASGTNVTFVASFLISFLTIFLPRKKMIPIAIFGLLLYLFISGFEAPLIRATLMTVSLFIAQEHGRVVSSWYILTITVYIMLLINPLWVSDLGFIMSFVSTASLMLFEKPISSKLRFLPSLLKSSLSTTLAAQVGITPILFVTFGQFNILSPLVNSLILWTIPIIMVSGALVALIFSFVPFVATLLLWLSYPFVLWFLGVVSLFS